MEAAGSGQQLPPAYPNPTAQTLTKPQKMAGSTRKRKMPGGEFQNSCYFKIRTIVKDLRPTFLEVIHTADFRDCKAAYDIRKKMETLLELYKQLRMETASSAPSERQSIDHQEKVDAKVMPPHPCAFPSAKDDPDLVRASTKEIKPQARVSITPEVKVATGTNDIEQQLQGVRRSYITGGSPIGWNFVICSSNEPVYYGLTKEAWRAKQIGKS